MTVTKEWIDQKKKELEQQYGRPVPLYRLIISGIEFIYRPLFRDEYKILQGNVTPKSTAEGPVLQAEDAARLEEEVVDKCVVWPEKVEASKLPAGAPTTISIAITNISGFIAESEPEAL